MQSSIITKAEQKAQHYVLGHMNSDTLPDLPFAQILQGSEF